jgi:hypothetical protein
MHSSAKPGVMAGARMLFSNSLWLLAYTYCYVVLYIDILEPTGVVDIILGAPTIIVTVAVPSYST